MTTKKETDLNSFFIFNSSYGEKEGEESKKILYYYPEVDNIETQIKNVGLVEGIIKFTQTFKPSTSVSSLHTNKVKQLYFQPEPNYWIVMILNLPLVTRIKENVSTNEYLEENLQDNVFMAVLKQSYYMYRLFWGKFEDTLNRSNLVTLKKRLEAFFIAYLKSLKLTQADILNVFGGIQYLPLNREIFLNVQHLVNLLESKWDCIDQVTFLYNEHIIWSGVEPTNMQIIYQYLIGTLLPANVETELQSGFIQRKSPLSPFSAFQHGRFITGPVNLKETANIGKVPKIFLYNSEGAKEYHLVVYRALSATICLYIRGETELKLELFKALDEYLNPKLTVVVNEIAEHCAKRLVTPTSETTPKFIYFNKINLAYKSTVHLDNKQTGNISCNAESLKIMADLKAHSELLGHASENIVKTVNDFWVVCKTSNHREFYIVLQQKNASLNEISEEVQKLCENEFKGIFFHPI